MLTGRRRARLLCVTTALSVFICVLVGVSWNLGNRGNRRTVRVPTERFWHRQEPSGSFWNREQQRLDFLHNPLLLAADVVSSSSNNDSLARQPKPDWLNDTGSSSSPPDPDDGRCEPDRRVATQVSDYNALPQRFRDFLLYMRCRSYPMLINQPRVCGGGHDGNAPYLLLAVKSLAPHFDRRQAIRQSWGRAGALANRTVATVFLLGNATSFDHHPDLSGVLGREAELHGDLLQWDYRDTFFNLTLKEVLFLEWFSKHCAGARYVFKGDDDVFVNTVRIIDFLADLPAGPRAKDLFVGHVIKNAGPHRDRKIKYFVPESVFAGQYPPYAGGGGFLYAGELALRLYNVSARVALYPIDDVYTGMCLRKLGLVPYKHKGFRTFDIEEKYRMNPCVYRGLMLVHSRTPQEMIQIWAWLVDPDVECQ